MRYAKPVAVSLCVLAAAGLVVAKLVGGCAHNDVFVPVRPKAGDKAIVRVIVVDRAEAQRRWSQGRSVYPERQRDLVIECVQSRGDKARFAVCYRSSGNKHRVAYTVSVDYETNDLDRRTVVRDPQGRQVARDQLVDGLPVPFTDFLAFDQTYLKHSGHRVQQLSTGDTAWIGRYCSEHPSEWTMLLHVSRNRKEVCDEDQRWRRGEWLWWQLRLAYANTDCNAVRLVPPSD